MKRQYRYKTAADSKKLFRTNWFDKLNDSVGDLHNAIANIFKDKSFLSKLTKKPLETIKYIDAYAFPKDGCAEIMVNLSEYESWYTDAWTFLALDDYDKIKESLDECTFITDNLSEFANDDGKKIIDQLTEIKKNIDHLKDDINRTTTSLGDGFNKSNNENIIKFFNSLSDRTEVNNELQSMSDLLGSFINACNNYKHYWVQANDENSELMSKVKGVRQQLEKQLQYKEDEAKNKREKNEQEQNRQKEENIQNDMEEWDEDQVVEYINGRLISIKGWINKLFNKAIKYGDDYFNSNNGGEPFSSQKWGVSFANSQQWKDCCNKYFNDNILQKITNGLHENQIGDHFEKNDLAQYIANVWKEINDNEFSPSNASGDESKKLLLFNEDKDSYGPIVEGQGEIIEALQIGLKVFFQKTIKDLSGHSSALWRLLHDKKK